MMIPRSAGRRSAWCARWASNRRRETGMTAAEFSQYKLQALREDGEFILYRGQRPGQGDEATVLLLGPFSTRPSRESAKRLEHEFSLRADLHPDWAVRPL